MGKAGSRRNMFWRVRLPNSCFDSVSPASACLELLVGGSLLAGDTGHPTPQLRLHISTSTALPDSASPVTRSTGTSDVEADTTDEEEEEDESDEPISSSRKSVSPDRTPRASNAVPSSPSLKRLRNAVSPIWSLASGANINDGMRQLALDQPTAVAPADDTDGPIPEISRLPQERDFIVPLSSDLAFFNLLTSALTSLSAFHETQQKAFQQSVVLLCRQISQSIQPSTASSSPMILPTPLTDSKPLGQPSTRSAGRGISKGTGTSKKDLYAWREIFSLWIESEIFESRAERTRGERPVEVAEARLKAFASEVVKRGLGDRRSIKGKRARGAWEEFLRLNVLLLDLKRFQLANINAARK